MSRCPPIIKREIMEPSGKGRLKLEDLASDLTKIVLKSIEPSELESLKQWGVNQNNAKHRLEIVILSTFSLRSAIFITQQSSTFDKLIGDALLLYVEQFLKISYVDVLTLGDTDQFENLLNKRCEEYESRDAPGSPIPRIGLRFGRNIGIDDIALVHWAETTFRTVRLTYVDYLKMINDRYELIC
jgi:hypothetical protein